MTTRMRTKAELEPEGGLMEVVCEYDNLKLAYQRVVENKGSAGVDGIGVDAFKDHLKQHWPTIKAKLLAGEYMPSAVRRVDIAKPQGGTRTLGIPTLTDRMIQQALHQVLLSALTICGPSARHLSKNSLKRAFASCTGQEFMTYFDLTSYVTSSACAGSHRRFTFAARVVPRITSSTGSTTFSGGACRSPIWRMRSATVAAIMLWAG